MKQLIICQPIAKPMLKVISFYLEVVPTCPAAQDKSSPKEKVFFELWFE